MPVFEQIRAYHIGLIALTALSYITGEFGKVHSWLGYGVAGVIVLRVLWGLVGPKQVGISRFFPHLADIRRIRWLNDPVVSRVLIAAVATALLTVSATGIALVPPDQINNSPRAEAGLTTTVISGVIVGPALASDDDDGKGSKREDSAPEELHEFAANLVVLTVALHVLYLFIFKRDLALFMVFVKRPAAQK